MEIDPPSIPQRRRRDQKRASDERTAVVVFLYDAPHPTPSSLGGGCRKWGGMKEGSWEIVRRIVLVPGGSYGAVSSPFFFHFPPPLRLPQQPHHHDDHASDTISEISYDTVRQLTDRFHNKHQVVPGNKTIFRVDLTGRPPSNSCFLVRRISR